MADRGSQIIEKQARKDPLNGGGFSLALVPEMPLKGAVGPAGNLHSQPCPRPAPWAQASSGHKEWLGILDLQSAFRGEEACRRVTQGNQKSPRKARAPDSPHLEENVIRPPTPLQWDDWP